eukprot:Nk52_evm23s913 gene=Nk52_evmTU23s913
MQQSNPVSSACAGPGKILSTEEERNEEDATLSRELYWFLCGEDGETLSVLANLSDMLAEACSLLSGAGGEADGLSAETSGTTTTHPLTTANNSVQGVVMVDGFRIVKASIEVKFYKWNRGQPFSCRISGSNPWNLAQVLNAHNYLQLAYSEVTKAYLQKREILRHVDFDAIQPYLCANRDQVWRVLDGVMLHLKKAREYLIFPSDIDTFTKEMDRPAVFQPRPPDDLIVDFYVVNGCLVTGVYGVQTIRGSVGKTSGMGGADSQKDALASSVNAYVGKVVDDDGTLYEIGEYVRLESCIVAYQKTLSICSNAQAVCQRLKDNVVAFSTFSGK